MTVCVCDEEQLEWFSERGAWREQGSCYHSTPLSIGLHTNTQEHTQIFPTSVKQGTIPLSSPFIPGKKLMALNCITGRRRGPEGVQNLVKAEQTWNFDLTEGRIIPHWQCGGDLFILFSCARWISITVRSCKVYGIHRSEEKMWRNCLHTLSNWKKF